MDKKVLRTEIKEVELELCDYFGFKKINSSIKKKYCLKTKYGKYHFYFNDLSIFGRFEDVAQLKSLPPRIQYCNGELYEIVYYPNMFSGKFNFHYDEVHDFIDTLARMAS